MVTVEEAVATPPWESQADAELAVALPEGRAAAEAVLREGIQRVLPPILVEATNEAQDAVACAQHRPVSVPSQRSEGLNVEAASLAAALGPAAAGALAAALVSWLGRRASEQSARQSAPAVPGWLRPALDPSHLPRLATQTQFSQLRTQYVREALSGTPILLTRYGSVVAALVPLEPGAYEEAVYPSAMWKIADAAEERWANAGTTPKLLTDEELAAIEKSEDRAATATSLGVDATGWAHLNPPENTEATATQD